MKVRKSLRRLKRMAYLGALTGTVAGVRRIRERRTAARQPAAPAAWPPLHPTDETKGGGA